MSPRGELVTDDRTNTLIISEVPERIKIIDGLIDTLDAANPQVQIEARIVEANASSLDTFGIQWGYNAIANAAHGNQTNLVFPNSIVSGGGDERQGQPQRLRHQPADRRQRGVPRRSPWATSPAPSTSTWPSAP